MVHHQVDICLRQFIKALSLRHHPADELMPHFDLRLLVWRTRITVVDPRPLEPLPVRPVLDAFRVRELTPVIRQDHGEQSSEILSSQTLVQIIINIYHTL